MFFLALAGVGINVVIFAILGGEHGHSHAGHSHGPLGHGHDHAGHSHSDAGHSHGHGHAHAGHSHCADGHNGGGCDGDGHAHGDRVPPWPVLAGCLVPCELVVLRFTRGAQLLV